MVTNRLVGLLLLFALGCAACNPEGDNPGGNAEIELQIGGTDVYEDTLKFGHGATLQIPFRILGSEGSTELSMSRLEGGLVMYDGQVLNNTTVVLDWSEGDVIFRPLEAGVHSFFLEARAASGSSSTAVIEIIAMENQRPQVRVTAAWVAEASPYHVRIDAGESLDTDADWGGSVIAYEFDLIGFYKTVTSRSLLDYIYPKPGRYQISVRVQDNDEAWSDPVVIDVEVE
ncbi:hypothetical protein IX84_21690 [Phaeodactylibacter xiamenensis]|uniref:PKD domain-containing protein n=2 Tax=Phaeodactylibacter xiamenensis TaxID=1524460 RepID=A0A098S2Z8_9BACT|nr:hypothetical protein IX84_21690 [Phaeodactylibacter xiamenensis]